ncbi:MAG TPA: ATP-binding cassette domain-containing protein [Acidimicrobiia bacterium]
MNGQALLIGATTGIGYALLAIGLVLVYRATRVVNFAHVEIGLFGATLAALVVSNYHWNYWLGLIAGVLAGALWGAAAELVVVRRLARRSTVVLLIATTGLAQVVLLATLSLPDVNAAGGYPVAFTGPIRFSGLEIPTQFRVVDVFVQSRVVALLVLALPAVAALGWFLKRTRYGLMIRASASAPETARLVGVETRKVSTMVWSLAGAFAAFTVIIVLPFSGAGLASTSEPAGPALLVRALVVALLARMRSLPAALAAGIAVGIGEAYLIRNVTDRPGITELALFGALLLLVLRMRASDDGPLSIANRAVIPDAARRLRSVRAIPVVGILAVFLALAAVPIVVTAPSQLDSWMFVLLLGAVAASATVLTGWAGRVSLGQYAFFGLGAATMLLVSGHGTVPLPFVRSSLQPDLPFLPALAVTGVVGGVAAALVGLPALRTRGLFLAVATLAFAVVMEEFILRQAFWTDGQATVSRLARPVFGPLDFRTPRALYYLVLAFLALVVVLSLRLRRTGSGRTMIAARDNPSALTASSVSVTHVTLSAFAFAGAVAALAGGLLTLVVPTVTLGHDFPATDSIRIIAVAIIGGLGSIVGAVVGALWVFGLPLLFNDSTNVALAASGVGMLILLLYLPGGLMAVGDAMHVALASWLQRRFATSEPSPRRARPPSVPRHAAPRRASAELGLRLRSVSVAFHSRVAVDDVDLDVREGEVVGLIGTNGAGKTTLMNAVSGFVPSRGRIELNGRRIDRLPPHRRCRLGLARSFQSAALYPGLSVRETLMVALEARGRSRFVPSLLALPPSSRMERAKRSEADEIIGFLGLGAFADRSCAELSTGTRRIVELAELLASDPSVLLLDEPTAGVAQREAEAFAPLIARVRDELRASVLLIEHDMPLVMRISDRVYCLETGRVIAEGTPSEVRRNPLVIESYLGVDERAISRSGSRPGAPSGALRVGASDPE